MGYLFKLPEKVFVLGAFVLLSTHKVNLKYNSQILEIRLSDKEV